MVSRRLAPAFWNRGSGEDGAGPAILQFADETRIAELQARPQFSSIPFAL
jgi:hypothetical protein